MINRLKIVKVLILVVFLGIELPLVAQPIKWPEGKKAAVVLTYDDGLNSQLDIAIPQLDIFGFKGTFFLYGYLPEKRFADWKAVSDRGHELGNHSLYHPCKGNGSKRESSRFLSDSYDVPSIIREIGMMNKLLFAISEKVPKSYAYPCSETTVGGVDYVDSLKESGLLTFARTGGNQSVISDFSNLEFFKIQSYSVKEGTASSMLIEKAEETINQAGLSVYIFHGIGGDYLSVGSNEHLKLLKYLDAHSDEIWVATFSEVMEYIQKTQINKE